MIKVLGITSGIGSMLVPFQFDENLKGITKVVGNIEWRKYYGKSGYFEKNFKAPYYYSMEEATEEFLSQKDIDIIHGHPECFTSPNVLITTNKGNKKISEIQVGDLVLTHKGRYRKVIRTIKNLSKTPPTIVTFGTSNSRSNSKKTISVTENHPIFVVETGWIPAKDLQVGDVISKLVMSKFGYHFDEEEIKWKETKIFKKNITLYNLGVEEDSSYIAKDIVVHNCGSYSQLSSGRVKIFDGTESDIGDFAGKVRYFNPRFFLMDDLYKSLTFYNAEYWANLFPDYDIFFEPISNYHYGNIQKYRRRFFIIGSRKEEKFSFCPGELPDHGKTVWDTIGNLPLEEDIPELGHVHFGHMNIKCWETGNIITYKDLAKRFLDAPPGTNLYYTNKNQEIKKKIGLTMLYKDSYSHVLTGGGYNMDPNLFHPITGLPLTVRERARIQGFPDEFSFYHGEDFFKDPKEEFYLGNKVTGKAMPVQFCRYAANQFISTIKGNTEEGSNQRYYGTIPQLITENKMRYCSKLGGYSNQEKACENCWNKNVCSVRNHSSLFFFGL